MEYVALFVVGFGPHQTLLFGYYLLAQLIILELSSNLFISDKFIKLG